MRHPRRVLGSALSVGVMLIIAAAALRQPQPPSHSFRIVFGLKDTEPTDWSGELSVADGTLLAMSGWRFDAKEDGILGDGKWRCLTHSEIAPEKRYPITDFAGKPKGKVELAPWPIGIYVTVRGNDPTVTLKLAKDTVKFRAAELSLGQPLPFLGGRMRVERIPEVSIVRPAAPLKAVDPVQDDYPAFWVHYRSGKHYLAWVAYQKAKTRVLLAERDGPQGKWSEPIEVAGQGDHFRVALATTHEGTLWVTWSSNQKQAWNLFARPYTNGKLGDTEQLSQSLGPNLWHRMTTDNKGRAWLVWQGFDKGRSGVFARYVEGTKWAGTRGLGRATSNLWDPTVVADPKTDRVWVGWDEYRDDNYRVAIAPFSATERPKSEGLVPEPSPLFQAHVSLAFDKDGRLWAAWDESGPQWGKDTGFLYGGGDRQDTTRLYASRKIRVKVLSEGKWLEPAHDLYAVMPNDMQEYNDYPQLQPDSEGRMWLAFRHRTCRRPREDGWAAQGRWDVYATCYLGDRWTMPVELPESGGRNDMRISSQRDQHGNVYFAYASDNRPYSLPGMPPRNQHVAVSRLGGAPKPGPMKLVAKKRDFPIAAPVHPKEKEQVARIRNHKIEIGGRTYRIYRGDLHRHTDISGDGPGDGSLMDLHRYALDAAAMDFVLVADHNMGNDNEYCWWRTQQANDLYTVPGSFISMYGYERSVKYPNGHRNIIWTERGHRTLPLPLKPLPAALKGDTAKLYDYLRKTGGICTLHTSASDQGTNWEDPHDPALEPFVEIFQGFHSAYEAPGAPLSADAKMDTIHGPFKADGYVSLALAKGYKLGFQSSSDHISTHVSYACVLAEEFSRKGLVAAMKKRHTYAATDNIVLDVRMGANLMGDEVRTAQPKIDVVVLGTNLLDRVEILRNNEVVHTQRPTAASAELRFLWQDFAPLKGEKASFYYVRVRQQDGQMAWASPFWVSP